MGRGPSQWTVGSQWIADGGVYPGMGETIGLAGTSPELADGGLYNDGGAVGDPPFDTLAANNFEDSVGAGGGYAGYYGGGGPMHPDFYPSGGSGDPEIGEVSESDFDNPLVGLAIFGGVTLGFFWALHRFRVGDEAKFASIKGTAGDLAIIGIGGAFIIPLVKSGVTAIADFFDWQPLYDTATYVNAS